MAQHVGNTLPESLINNVNGITLLGSYSYPQEMQSAWGSIVSYGAKPWGTIECNNELSWQSLVDQWNRLCVTLKVKNESNELLFSVGGFAGSGIWQWIKCIDSGLLLNISIYEKQPEFIVMDMNCTTFSAITCEENEFLLFAAHRLNNNWLLLEDSK